MLKAQPVQKAPDARPHAIRAGDRFEICPQPVTSVHEELYRAGTELILSPPVPVRIAAVVRTQQTDFFNRLLYIMIRVA